MRKTHNRHKETFTIKAQNLNKQKQYVACKECLNASVIMPNVYNRYILYYFYQYSIENFINIRRN